MNEEISLNLEVEEIEGYAYCSTHEDMCMNDCAGSWQGSPILSDIS